MKELIAIQSELKAPKSQFNKFGNYKYRNQEDILEALKPLLKKNNCSMIITDEVRELNGILVNEARCILSNGKETVETNAYAGIEMQKKGMDLAMCFGTASSYSRKYALNGMFLIDDTKDADSDEYQKVSRGVASSTPRVIQQQQPVNKPTLTNEQFEKVKNCSKEQLIATSKKFNFTPEQAAWLKENFGKPKKEENVEKTTEATTEDTPKRGRKPRAKAPAAEAKTT